MYNAIAKKESAFHHFGGKSKTGVVHETSSETAFVNENGFGQRRTQKGKAAQHETQEEKKHNPRLKDWGRQQRKRIKLVCEIVWRTYAYQSYLRGNHKVPSLISSSI